jgi:hypothetical protein
MDVEAGGDPSAATFTFHNEDHTIGNTSRSTMHLRNSLHLRVGDPQRERALWPNRAPRRGMHVPCASAHKRASAS